MFYKAVKDTFGVYGDIWTTNIVKCNPPGNRTPTEIEVKICSTFILKEVHIVKPRMIVALGRTAINYFMPHMKGRSIRSMLGSRFTWRGIDLYVLYHPAYACRNGPKFEKVYLGWFKILKRKLDELVSNGRE